MTTIAEIDAIADLNKDLARRFHALPDELILIIRNYARERTPQERLARLYRHHAKMHALYVEPMSLINYAEKEPSKFGYNCIVIKKKRAECFKKNGDRITRSHIPFAELREKMWWHITDRYHELLRKVQMYHLRREVISKKKKIRTLGKKMVSIKNDDGNYRGVHLSVYVDPRVSQGHVVWNKLSLRLRDAITNRNATCHKLLHDEAEKFALEYA
jgi:hypothetical protein